MKCLKQLSKQIKKPQWYLFETLPSKQSCKRCAKHKCQQFHPALLRQNLIRFRSETRQNDTSSHLYSFSVSNVTIISCAKFTEPLHSRDDRPFVLLKQKKILAHRWFSRYVTAAMLVDENKRSVISSFCSSTSN